MLSLSSLLRIFCSNGKSDANESNSAFSLSRCRFEGLLLVTPSFGGGFKLQVEEKKYNVIKNHQKIRLCRIIQPVMA